MPPTLELAQSTPVLTAEGAPPSDTGPTTMRWRFGSGRQIAWAFALVLLRMAIMGGLLYGVLRPLLTHGEDPRSGRPIELVESALMTIAAMVFAWVFLGRVARASWKDLGFSREKLGRNVAIGVMTFAIGLVYIGGSLWSEGRLDEAFATFAAYTFRQRILMLLVAIHVIFGEEMLFRSYLQPGLRARFSAPVTIGITALVFAAYHVKLDPREFLGIVFWGVLWGTVREKTGSSIPSSVAHFMNWAILGWI